MTVEHVWGAQIEVLSCTHDLYGTECGRSAYIPTTTEYSLQIPVSTTNVAIHTFHTPECTLFWLHWNICAEK